MDKKISIVTAYYNRKRLFLNTLKTIEKSKYKDIVEIIAVDDASNDDNRIDEFPDIVNLDLKVIRIEKDDKWWVNPSISFNIGFKYVNTDIIIFQNPECLHFGDIIDYTLNHIKENLYLNYACYSVDKNLTNDINSLDFNKDIIMNDIEKIIFPLNNKGISADGTTAWYNHSIYRSHKLHFCSSIMKKDLDELGGFDERYANGVGYDDNDLLLRIIRKKMNIQVIDKPFVIHQFHGNTNYNENRELVIKNSKLYQSVKMNENKYKAN